jgi:hypothetical protein
MSDLRSDVAERYVILLYSQPDSFSPPANLSQANTAVSVFNFPDYIKVRFVPYAPSNSG